MEQKCNHAKSEIREHRRKNYPFGKKSKPKFYKGYKFTQHCKDYGKIISKWKYRG